MFNVTKNALPPRLSSPSSSLLAGTLCFGANDLTLVVLSGAYFVITSLRLTRTKSTTCSIVRSSCQNITVAAGYAHIHMHDFVQDSHAITPAVLIETWRVTGDFQRCHITSLELAGSCPQRVRIHPFDITLRYGSFIRFNFGRPSA